MKRRRHRRTWPANLLSLLLGVLIGFLAGLAHWHSVNAPLDVVATVTPVEPPPVVSYELQEPTKEPEPYNDPGIPDEVEEAARAAGEIYGISPELLEAIAWHESRFQTDAVNGDCTGLMQVSLYWHADRMERLGVTEAEMWEAGPNMMVAADFLAELFRIYDDDLGAVLMRYNGDGRLDDYLAGGELSWYAASVMDMAELLAEHEVEEVVPMSAQKE